jgi:hypothetical protein
MSKKYKELQEEFKETHKVADKLVRAVLFCVAVLAVSNRALRLWPVERNNIVTR